MNDRTGYVSCGAYDCWAIIDDTPEERTAHLRTEHPDLIATLYLPCEPPEEQTCPPTSRTSPAPDAPHDPAAT